MNAFEKAMKAIAATIARGAPKKRQPSKKARVVSAPARHTRPRAVQLPPPISRAEVSVRPEPTPPAPTPPEVEGPISAPLWVPAVTPPRPVPTSAPRAVQGPHRTERFVARPGPQPPAPGGSARGSCKAVDADSGRTCKLPAHPESPDAHRSERGPFIRVLQPGALPRLHQQLDAVATRREGVDYSAAELAPTKGKYFPKKRDKAHAGETTTEAHPPERSKYFEPKDGVVP